MVCVNFTCNPLAILLVPMVCFEWVPALARELLPTSLNEEELEHLVAEP
jgi:hypothetical protein